MLKLTVRTSVVAGLIVVTGAGSPAAAQSGSQRVIWRFVMDSTVSATASLSVPTATSTSSRASTVRGTASAPTR